MTSNLGARTLVVACALVACKAPGSSSDPPEAPASPQAKAEPAPLANIPATTTSAQIGTLVSFEGGVAPLPLREDRPVGADTSSKESVGYSLSAVLRATDVPAPPKGPEVNIVAIEAAKKKTEPRLTIDLSATRARFVLEGDGFVLPGGTELRARVDRYGFIVLADDGATYRVAAPGALRALIGERRLDVAPLSIAEVTPRGDGARRVGRPTRKAEVSTRAARASFEIAHLPDSGEGGPLLCRALLDLMNAPPSTPLCGDGDIPLHAEFHWTTTGAIVFDAISLTRRTDFTSQALAAPPSTASFAGTALSPRRSLVLLAPADLAALRAGEPDATLTLGNSTSELRFVWIDGAPLAWLAPGAREAVHGLVRGHYVLQWRTFLGDALEPPETVTLPATSDLGGDAGP